MARSITRSTATARRCCWPPGWAGSARSGRRSSPCCRCRISASCCTTIAAPGKAPETASPTRSSRWRSDVLDLADGLGIGTVPFRRALHRGGDRPAADAAACGPGVSPPPCCPAAGPGSDPWFHRCFAVRDRDPARRAGQRRMSGRRRCSCIRPGGSSAQCRHVGRRWRRRRSRISHRPRSSLSRIAALMAWGPAEALAATNTPALVVCADDDHLTPPHYSIDMHRLIPGSDLAILPDGGHFNTTSRAAEFNETMLGWLLAQIGTGTPLGAAGLRPDRHGAPCLTRRWRRMTSAWCSTPARPSRAARLRRYQLRAGAGRDAGDRRARPAAARPRCST